MILGWLAKALPRSSISFQLEKSQTENKTINGAHQHITTFIHMIAISDDWQCFSVVANVRKIWSELFQGRIAGTHWQRLFFSPLVDRLCALPPCDVAWQLCYRESTVMVSHSHAQFNRSSRVNRSPIDLAFGQPCTIEYDVSSRYYRLLASGEGFQDNVNGIERTLSNFPMLWADVYQPNSVDFRNWCFIHPRTERRFECFVINMCFIFLGVANRLIWLRYNWPHSTGACCLFPKCFSIWLIGKQWKLDDAVKLTMHLPVQKPKVTFRCFIFSKTGFFFKNICQQVLLLFCSFCAEKATVNRYLCKAQETQATNGHRNKQSDATQTHNVETNKQTLNWR